MPELNSKFKGKYRIQSRRLKGWDYATPAYYFITICTQNRIPWLGKIKNDRVILSQLGKITSDNLEKIPIIYPNVSLDAWIVMPNHIHAVIVIGEPVETPHWGVSTKGNWRPGALGVIISQFKSICTKRIRMMGFIKFAWQPRFYDHIIRDEKELKKIRSYILGNPTKWAEDEYFSSQTSKYR